MNDQVNQKLCGLEKMGVLLGLAASIFYAKALLNRGDEQHFEAQPRHVRHHFLELAIAVTKRGWPAEQVDGLPDVSRAPAIRTAADEVRYPVRSNPTQLPAAVTTSPVAAHVGGSPAGGVGDGVTRPALFDQVVAVARAEAARVLAFPDPRD